MRRARRQWPRHEGAAEPCADTPLNRKSADPSRVSLVLKRRVDHLQMALEDGPPLVHQVGKTRLQLAPNARLA